MSEFRQCSDPMKHGQHSWSIDFENYSLCKGVRKAEEPPVIGNDIEFLLDSPAGHAVANIVELASMTEADAYDTDLTVEVSDLYVLMRRYPPKKAWYRIRLIGTQVDEHGGTYEQKLLVIIDVDGGLIAQAPFRVYRQAASA